QLRIWHRNMWIFATGEAAELADAPDPIAAALAAKRVTTVIALHLARTAARLDLAITGTGGSVDGWEHVVSRPIGEPAQLVSDAAAAIASALDAPAPRAVRDTEHVNPIYDRYAEALSWWQREHTKAEFAEMKRTRRFPKQPLEALVAEHPKAARAT